MFLFAQHGQFSANCCDALLAGAAVVLLLFTETCVFLEGVWFAVLEFLTTEDASYAKFVLYFFLISKCSNSGEVRSFRIYSII